MKVTGNSFIAKALQRNVLQ